MHNRNKRTNKCKKPLSTLWYILDSPMRGHSYNMISQSKTALPPPYTENINPVPSPDVNQLPSTSAPIQAEQPPSHMLSILKIPPPPCNQIRQPAGCPPVTVINQSPSSSRARQFQDPTKMFPSDYKQRL